MDIRTLQVALNARGITPPLAVDGNAGKKTMGAVDAMLVGLKIDGWADARRRIAAEQIIYRDAKIEVGVIDGLVGEQTRHAREVYYARQSGDKTKIDAVETWRDTDKPPPAGNVAPIAGRKPSTIWPRQNAAEMDRFFGAKGTKQVTLKLPFPMRIAWEPAKTVNSFSCNAKVHDSMLRIWQRTLAHYGHDEIKRLRLDMYGGCLNVRKMRGGSAWSIHSWGCAIDIDPDRNQLKFKRASATLDDAPYQPFWGFVYDEGAISLGIERDFDWMHFQFSRL